MVNSIRPLVFPRGGDISIIGEPAIGGTVYYIDANSKDLYMFRGESSRENAGHYGLTVSAVSSDLAARGYLCCRPFQSIT